MRLGILLTVIIIIIVGWLVISALKAPPQSDHVSVRFNMPHCKKLQDGTWECSLKKLPEYQ